MWIVHQPLATIIAVYKMPTVDDPVEHFDEPANAVVDEMNLYGAVLSIPKHVIVCG